MQSRTLCKIPEVNCSKIEGVVQVSELDHQFFVFLLFFHVDLVQILQGSKLPLGEYSPAGPDSTSWLFSWLICAVFDL